MNATLYYIADPMCSWCWGFHPVLQKVRGALPEDIQLVYVMGGLAKDSDEPMPDDIRAYVQNAWREVGVRTGARFNWDFWMRCSPVRSTYPACRGVLSAGKGGRSGLLSGRSKGLLPASTQPFRDRDTR